MKNKNNKKKLSYIAVLIIIFIVVCSLTILILHQIQPKDSPTSSTTPPTATPSPTPTATATPTAEPTEEPTEEPVPTAEVEIPTEYSIFTDTDSLLVVANKKNRLPEGYEPADLVVADIPCTNGTAYIRAVANSAIQSMYNDALAEGVYLAVSSAYRSESYQSSLYYGYVANYGAESADTFSSRPGYSDHQTGLAADFVEGGAADFDETFENTASGQWLASNAYRYGFIMRYPRNKDAYTGYHYEPWHFRYIGVEQATAMHNTDPTISMEEYYNVSGGDYAE